MAHDVGDAAKALEAVLLKQLLSASGAFRGSEAAGGALYADLFAEALANAAADGGGLALAKVVEDSISVPSGPQLGPVLSGSARVSSSFGGRVDPLDGHFAQHRGLDLAAKEGTLILAAEDGVVLHAGDRGGYGQAVEVGHGSRTTLYAHASELLVQEGQVVRRGEPIARVGHSGRATGDHLHFELRVGGRPVNPASALKAYVERADNPSGGPGPRG